MKLLKRYLIALNDNRLLDQPYEQTRDELAIHVTSLDDFHTTQRITRLFTFADQRGMLHERTQIRKKQGKSQRVQLDEKLDKAFRSLLGLD